jgi:hypothetical protein
MSRKSEDTRFTCLHCQASVPRHCGGSYRNHCPVCLFSLHVDVTPGDRAADCGGLMEPTGLDYSGKKGYVLLHRCRRCGHLDRNRVAPDDSTDAITALSRSAELPR